MNPSTRMPRRLRFLMALFLSVLIAAQFSHTEKYAFAQGCYCGVGGDDRSSITRRILTVIGIGAIATYLIVRAGHHDGGKDEPQRDSSLPGRVDIGIRGVARN